MQVKPKKSNKKPIVIAIVILTVLVGVFLTYLYVTYPDNAKNSINNNSENIQDIETDKDTPSTEVKDSTTDSDDSAPTKVENKTPIQYEGEKPTDSSTGDNEQFRIPEE